MEDIKEVKLEDEHEHHHEDCDDHDCCCHHHDKHEHHHEDCDDHDCCCHHDKHEHHHHHNTHCSCCHDDCEDDDNDEKKEHIILIIRLAIAIILLVVSFFVNNVVSIILLSLSYLMAGYDVLYKAIYNLFHGEPFDECFLMSVASLTAILVSFINPSSGIDGFDGVLVMILYQIGELLQDFAVDKSKESIKDMISIDVKKVIRLNKDIEEEIDVDDIKIDDILLIKPGQVLPVDGIVLNGQSSLNTQAITGESKLLDVDVGDVVISSCINNDGSLKIKATSTIENSTTANIKKAIDDASKNKAKSETFIRKFAKIYTPVVIFIALIIMFVIPLFTGFSDTFMTWLYKGLSIMIISCPCAIVISVPLASFVGIGKAAKNGILFKGGNHLEGLATIKAFAFDKTGTLTKGDFEVTHLEFNDDLGIDLLYSLEKEMSHPIANSIVSYLNNKAHALNLDKITNLPGLGGSAFYNNKELLVGNEKLLLNHQISFNKKDDAGTVVYVAYDNKYLGCVLIEDTLKDGVKETMSNLNKNHDLYLITGDNKKIASKVADYVGITNVYSEMLPEDKLNVVKEIKDKETLAYVGDGINDAACLISADVGIAMKSLDSDMAISASDVVIMDGNIKSIYKAKQIARKTSLIIKENIFGSLLVKLVIVILAISLAHLPIYVSIIADVGVCLLAIFNSLRIMLGKYN